MAIEFHCPSCNVTIRVADSDSGKKGSCPRCGEALLVPHIAQPGAELSAAAVPEAPPQPVAPATPTVTPVNSVGWTPNIATKPGSTGTASVAAHLKQKRKRGRQAWLVYAAPLAGVALLLGGLGYIYLWSGGGLDGEMTAQQLNVESLPEVLIVPNPEDIADIDLPDALTKISASPDILRSGLLSATLSADQHGLVVQLTRGAQVTFVAVDPSSQSGLMNWLKDNRGRIESRKNKEFREAVSTYIHLKAEGTSSTTAPPEMRDQLALNAQIGPLGYVLEALAGKRICPCIHEDPQGRLIFAIPRGTTSFWIRGKTAPGAEPLYPGEFRVTVSGTTTPSAATAETIEETAPKPDDAKPDDSGPAGMPQDSDETMPDDSVPGEPMEGETKPAAK